MSFSRGLRRTSAVVSHSTLGPLAAGITAVSPAHAGRLDCLSGSITVSGECTAPGPEGVSQACEVVGGGGGATATNDDGGEDGPGGGGGSYTNPIFTTGTKFATATSGGDSDAGSDGEIILVASSAPQVKTQAAVPTVSSGTATLTSMVNANGSDTEDIQIRYSQSATFDSSNSATISPASATGSSDTTVTGTAAGLASGTWYYQVMATNGAGTTYGEVETFTVGGSTEPLSALSLPDQVVAGRQTPVTVRVTINGQTVDGTAAVYHATARNQRIGSFVCEAQIVNGIGKCNTPAQLVTTVTSNNAGKWASKVGYSNPATLYCAVVPQGESKTIKVTKSGYKVLGSANRSAARGDLVYC